MAIEDFKYQYSFDKEGLAGPPVSGWGEHLYDQGGSPMELHFSNLFDQNEDEAGELFDWSTGERIDNSTYNGIEDLQIIDPMSDVEADAEIIDPDIEVLLNQILGELALNIANS